VYVHIQQFKNKVYPLQKEKIRIQWHEVLRKKVLKINNKFN